MSRERLRGAAVAIRVLERIRVDDDAMPPRARQIRQLAQVDLAALARLFGIGPITRAEGLAQGSINTLYRLETSAGRFVLRISEGGRSESELRFELSLVDYLARAHFPVPQVVHAGAQPFTRVHDKPAVLFHHVPGEELELSDVTREKLLELGAKLARLHKLAEGFSERLENRYDAAWLAAMARAGGPLDRHPRADAEVRAVLPTLEAEAREWSRLAGLPTGAIHADLFRDNVRFIGGRVSAIFDWEMACTDAFALDLAIALNAWTFSAAGRFEAPLATALVAGYQSLRPLFPEERDALWPLARAAAARYTASRLADFHLSDLPPERLLRKDWRRYRDRLHALRAMGPAGFSELVFTR